MSTIHAEISRRIVSTALGRVLLAVVLAIALLLPAPATAAPAPAAVTNPRSFTCSGNAGDPYAAYTVSGQLTSTGSVIQARVMNYAGTLVSQRNRASNLGPSAWHTGFTEWDITGTNPDHFTYHLSIPPAPPGGGGFMDADLFVDLAGAGNLQVPMFDCAVSGGAAYLSTPPARPFRCEGLVDYRTHYVVTGTITHLNVPTRVSVTNVATGSVLSYRGWKAARVGPSWLHAGYTEWDITGPGLMGDTVHLNLSPVLPPAGGYFDADLDLGFAAGGGVQVPVFDCRAG